MPRFQSTRHVPHGADRMFALVADVERYPEFLPLCESLRVLSRSTDEKGREVLVAVMGVGYRAIKESFTTRVTLDREADVIDVSYVDGPFRYLENRWSFRPQGEGSAVVFDIDYEFRNTALRLLMGAMFDRAFRTFADAFERRADSVYGRARRASV